MAWPATTVVVVISSFAMNTAPSIAQPKPQEKARTSSPSGLKWLRHKLTRERQPFGAWKSLTTRERLDSVSTDELYKEVRDILTLDALSEELLFIDWEKRADYLREQQSKLKVLVPEGKVADLCGILRNCGPQKLAAASYLPRHETRTLIEKSHSSERQMFLNLFIGKDDRLAVTEMFPALKQAENSQS